MTTKAIQLILVDEVCVKFEGLTQTDIKQIIEDTKKYKKGYFTSPSYKIGEWDGKESHFREDGFTYFYMLDDVLDVLEKKLGYELDNDIEIVDLRTPFEEEFDPIDDQFLIEEVGFPLRKHQVDAVNTALKSRQGIIEAATNAGKTLICAALVKKLDPILQTVTIVPSGVLLNQTYEDYKKCSFKTCRIRTQSNEEIEKKIEEGYHFVVTWQKLKNIKELFRGFRGAFIIDEVHNFGETLEEICMDQLSECPIRIGMTGSVPTKDTLKCEKIFCHVGDSIIFQAEFKELDGKGYMADHHIEMIQTFHTGFHQQFDQDKWDWEKETAYTDGNRDRIDAIADYIKGLSTTNTMILTHSKLGEQLAERLGVDFIDKDIRTEVREELYSEFDEKDDTVLVCTYGTSSTGLSINRIFRLILIDIGKNPTRIAQSIGRGLRKDGVVDEVEIIDIYADSKYSMRHYGERKSFYRKKGYQYTDSKHKILV